MIEIASLVARVLADLEGSHHHHADLDRGCCRGPGRLACCGGYRGHRGHGTQRDGRFPGARHQNGNCVILRSNIFRECSSLNCDRAFSLVLSSLPHAGETWSCSPLVSQSALSRA